MPVDSLVLRMMDSSKGSTKRTMLMNYWESESENILGSRRNIFVIMRGEEGKN